MRMAIQRVRDTTKAPLTNLVTSQLACSQRCADSPVLSDGSSGEVHTVAKQRRQMESHDPSRLFLCENGWDGE